MDREFLEATGIEQPEAWPAIALVTHSSGEWRREVTGRANLELNVPANGHSRFHVASIAKQFTGLLTALFIARGKLRLTDEIGSLLDWLPESCAGIRLHHLLFHTSGLRDQWPLAYFSGLAPGDVIDTASVRRWTARSGELNFRPGTRHLYCNTGYTLLALALERVSGLGFGALLRQEVLGPLGMQDTEIVEAARQLIENRVQGYENRDGTWSIQDPPYAVIGSTCMRTCAADMQTWLGADLDSAMFREARDGGFFTPGHLDDGTPLRYGFGLIHDQMGGQHVIMHGGYDFGFNAALLRSLDSDTGVFACGAGSYVRLEQEAVRLFRGMVSSSGPASASAPAAEQGTARLREGTYANADCSDVRRVETQPDGSQKLLWMQGFAIRPSASVAEEFDLVGSAAKLRQPASDQLMIAIGDDVMRLDLLETGPAGHPTLTGAYYSEELRSVLVIEADGRSVSIQFGNNPPESLHVASDRLVQWSSYWGVLETSDDGTVSSVLVSHPRCLNVRFDRIE